VAALWTWFLARSNHLRLPGAASFAMFVAVWVLYAADRLLDSRAAAMHLGSMRELEARHLFHRRHQVGFRVGIALSALALAALAPRFPPSAIRLYLVLAAMLAAYFVLIHARPARGHRLPKELAVGIFFSAAAFIPTVAAVPSLIAPLLPAAVLFAVLCSLNCLFIHAWEHPRPGANAHPATGAALERLTGIASATVAAGLALAAAGHGLPRLVPLSCAMAAALLLAVHGQRGRMAASTLRAAADLCLLTPLLILPVLYL
jgi:hypothetical protein